MVSWLLNAMPMLMPMLDLGVTEEHRLGDGLDHPAGHLLCLIEVGQVLQQHRELVATQPGDGVCASHAASQPVGHGQQDAIAADVAELVVHGLEAVDVREQHRDTGRAALDPGQCVVQAIGEQGPVGEPGQAIVECLATQLLVQAGVLERHRSLRREARGEGHVGRAEPTSVTSDLGDADGLAACDEGHHQQCTGAFLEQDGDLCGISVGVVDVHRRQLLALDHPPGQWELVEHVAPVVARRVLRGPRREGPDLAFVRAIDRDDAQVRPHRLLQVPCEQLRHACRIERPGHIPRQAHEPRHVATRCEQPLAIPPQQVQHQDPREGRVHKAHDDGLDRHHDRRLQGADGGRDGHAQRHAPGAYREPPQ